MNKKATKYIENITEYHVGIPQECMPTIKIWCLAAYNKGAIDANQSLAAAKQEIEHLRAVVEKYRGFADGVAKRFEGTDALSGILAQDALAFDKQTLGGQQGGEGTEP